MVQVQTLASLKDWEALEALAKEKKNVLPIPVYIAASKANGAPTQATARYPCTSHTLWEVEAVDADINQLERFVEDHCHALFTMPDCLMSVSNIRHPDMAF